MILNLPFQDINVCNIIGDRNMSLCCFYTFSTFQMLPSLMRYYPDKMDLFLYLGNILSKRKLVIHFLLQCFTFYLLNEFCKEIEKL